MAITCVSSSTPAGLNTLVTAAIAGSLFPLGAPSVSPRAKDGKRLNQLITSTTNSITAYQVVSGATVADLLAAMATAIAASWIQHSGIIVNSEAADGKTLMVCFQKGGTPVYP